MDKTVLQFPITATSRRMLADEEIVSEDQSRMLADEEIVSEDHSRALQTNRAEYDRLYALLSGQSFWTPPGYAQVSPEGLLGEYSQYWNANYASRKSLYTQLRTIRSTLDKGAYLNFYNCYKN